MKRGRDQKCPKCGAFIPDWADSCLACGGATIKVEGDVIDLSPLLLVQSRSFSVKIGNYTIKKAYLIENSLFLMPDGRATLKLEVSGEL